MTAATAWLIVVVYVCASVVGITEAYALAEGGDMTSGGGDLYAREAIRTLLTEIENNRTNIMVVLAGYKDKMLHFFRMDPGLDRRFPANGWLELPNYEPEELSRIAEVVARTKFDKEFAPGLEPLLTKHIADFHHRDIASQNGALSRVRDGGAEWYDNKADSRLKTLLLFGSLSHRWSCREPHRAGGE